MKRMITRTIELNTYIVRTLNVETAEVLDIDYTVGTNYKPDKILTQLRAEHETDSLKLVAVINHATETRLYAHTKANNGGYACIPVFPELSAQLHSFPDEHLSHPVDSFHL